MEVLPTLENMIGSFDDVSESALKMIAQAASPAHYAKGDYLIRSGTVCRQLFFLQKGIVRGFVSDGKKEVTTWLTAEGEMATAIRSFIKQQPTGENVQAIEACYVLAISYDELYHLLEKFPKLNVVVRKILEQYYCDAEERAYIIRLSNARVKYDYFLATKGNLVNRLPLKYIASYLGMTLETLSRMRTKISQKKVS